MTSVEGRPNDYYAQLTLAEALELQAQLQQRYSDAAEFLGSVATDLTRINGAVDNKLLDIPHVESRWRAD